MSGVRGCRGAGVFDYTVVLLLTSGVALVAANAFAKGPEATLRREGTCVTNLACEKSRAASGSIAPQERSGATAAWDGLRAEANVTVSELEGAARSPADVVRGVEFMVDHPALAMKALFVRRAERPAESGAPEAGTAEEGGRAAARLASGLSLANVGRIAKLGAMVARHDAALWDLPAQPAAPVDPLAEAPAAPAPGTAPARSDAGAP